MATPTTVLEFAQNTRDADAAAKASATTALQSAQGALASAKTTHASAAANLSAKEKEIAGKRVEVAEADTPAEGAALLAQLTTLIAQQRDLQFALVQAGAAVAKAEGDLTAATAELARIAAKLARSETQVAEAATAAGLRTGWKTAATAPPLDTLPAEATASLGEDPYAAATAKVTGDFPAKLRDASRNGFDAETARMARLEASADAAETLLMEEMERNGGAWGLVARRRMELDRAERTLRAWTERAGNRRERALGLLTALAGSDPLLSPTEHAGVAALDTTASQDAADLRVDLAGAEYSILDCKLDLEEATATVRAEDPSADPAMVQAVIDAQDRLNVGNQDLTNARNAFAAGAAAFKAWTAEVPDPAWRKLIGYLEADGILRELGGLDPAEVTQLVDDVTSAESNLAAALAAAEQHANTVASLEASLALRQDQVTRTAATQPERLLSAVRGDA